MPYQGRVNAQDKCGRTGSALLPGYCPHLASTWESEVAHQGRGAADFKDVVVEFC